MPRGAPRGHGIFCRSAEGSGKTASVFPLLALFALDRVSRSAPSLSCPRRGLRVKALSSPFERHSASRIARSAASRKSIDDVVKCVSLYQLCPPPNPPTHIPFGDVSMYRTYRHGTLPGDRLCKLYWCTRRERKRCGRQAQQLALSLPACKWWTLFPIDPIM